MDSDSQDSGTLSRPELVRLIDDRCSLTQPPRIADLGSAHSTRRDPLDRLLSPESGSGPQNTTGAVLRDLLQDDLIGNNSSVSAEARLLSEHARRRQQDPKPALHGAEVELCQFSSSCLADLMESCSSPGLDNDELVLDLLNEEPPER